MSLAPTIALAVATASAPNPGAYDFTDSLLRQGYVAVALHDSGVGHLYAQGTVNGRAVKVLVDTGASNTVIDADLAKEMMLPTTASGRSGAGVGSARLAANKVEEIDLAVGGVRIRQPVYTMDLAHVRAALASRGVAPPSVVLGADAMRALSGVLVYSRNVLYLLPR
jgi:hypothetical protein